MSQRLDMPTPAAIRDARVTAGMTQAQAAALVLASKSGWRKWEAGERNMPPLTWEYWRVLSGLDGLPARATTVPPQTAAK